MDVTNAPVVQGHYDFIADQEGAWIIAINPVSPTTRDPIRFLVDPDPFA